MLKNYWTSVELAGISHIPEWGVDQRVSPFLPNLADMAVLSWKKTWTGNEKTETFEWVFGTADGIPSGQAETPQGVGRRVGSGDDGVERGAMGLRVGKRRKAG